MRQCTCRAGLATACTTTDCSVRHPGCVDKEGIMYREGDTFVPKGELYSYLLACFLLHLACLGDCNTCSCRGGGLGWCTSRDCDVEEEVVEEIEI